MPTKKKKNKAATTTTTKTTSAPSQPVVADEPRESVAEDEREEAAVSAEATSDEESARDSEPPRESEPPRATAKSATAKSATPVSAPQPPADNSMNILYGAAAAVVIACIWYAATTEKHEMPQGQLTASHDTAEHGEAHGEGEGDGESGDSHDEEPAAAALAEGEREEQPSEDEAPAANAPNAPAPSAPPSSPPSAALMNPASLTERAPERYDVELDTTKGSVVIEVTRAWSPNGADRFYNLAKNGFYDDVAFFRVVSGFMAQVGINGRGEVNAVWREARISDDPVTQQNTRGMVSFATSGPNSRTTQFFINFGDNRNLDGMGFSPFGRVRDMAPIDALYSGYGEGAPRGNGPFQGRVQQEGNTYLRADFPQLDYIRSARVVERQ